MYTGLLPSNASGIIQVPDKKREWKAHYKAHRLWPLWSGEKEESLLSVPHT